MANRCGDFEELFFREVLEVVFTLVGNALNRAICDICARYVRVRFIFVGVTTPHEQT